MPFKACPNCSSPCGVRTHKCKCGFLFTNGNAKVDKKSDRKTSKPSYVSGGEWRWETHEGKSRIAAPAPLPRDRTITVDEVQDYVRYEGVGDAIHFIDPKKIGDEKLAQMWKEARGILKTIVMYVYDRKNTNEPDIS